MRRCRARSHDCALHYQTTADLLPNATSSMMILANNATNPEEHRCSLLSKRTPQSQQSQNPTLTLNKPWLPSVQDAVEPCVRRADGHARAIKVEKCTALRVGGDRRRPSTVARVAGRQRCMHWGRDLGEEGDVALLVISPTRCIIAER